MSETIAAISTAMGVGGIAVIRISGDDALKIADKVFVGKDKLTEAPTHTVHYGFIRNSRGENVDEVLATVMRAPRTFTREDVVEISVHGGIVNTRHSLDAIISAGARMAQPGEFTKRAFLNGRIDLSQAEAVIDIINSKNDLSQRNAFSQLRGGLSDKIEAIRARLVTLAAKMQVIIDYPDEDLEDVTNEDIRNEAFECGREVQRLYQSADCGKIIREGITTTIAGKPNVGKSSLLNSLAGTDRAIVTDIAGTTRDVIEEYINLSGVPLRLIDTAGIRDAKDEVEKIGVERSRQSIKDADLVIIVLDGTEIPDDEDFEVLSAARGKDRVILINKTDLGHSKYTAAIKAKACGSPVIEVSAVTGAGLEKLTDYIKEKYNLGELSMGDGAVVTNMRHKTALQNAGEALDRVVSAIDGGMPSDIASIDINAAIDSLGEITGETVSESIVNSIFHNFCVGK